ncbi:DUF2894 domain-containing protein [Rhodoferax sp.]|uniref:DUF2894 domain-containing protein n=1 Tax=Rhodoferax sp. TaxID=50421 RepID=UPI0027180354|nr:DUF2894 domain-containing protein [Rhodoferax sp.]MDO8319783.1 DUF2894 domain-containing protein [Rhodoferax sp.]
MTQVGHGDKQPLRSETSQTLSGEIAALRLAGAEHFDPVRLVYLQALAKRANAHPGQVKQLLDVKLVQALLALRTRFEQAQADAQDAMVRAVAHDPQAAADLQQLFTKGDFKAVHRSLAALQAPAPHAALGELVRSLAQQVPAHADAGWEDGVNAAAGSRPELKSMRYFRNTWSKLSVDNQLSRALDQAPKNAGPINSHRLVLRSLALMRDISPDYINRFTSYLDTLLCLDQCDQEAQASAKKAGATPAGKKTTGRRAKSR